MIAALERIGSQPFNPDPAAALNEGGHEASFAVLDNDNLFSRVTRRVNSRLDFADARVHKRQSAPATRKLS